MHAYYYFFNFFFWGGGLTNLQKIAGITPQAMSIAKRAKPPCSTLTAIKAATCSLAATGESMVRTAVAWDQCYYFFTSPKKLEKMEGYTFNAVKWIITQVYTKNAINCRK
jgi:hypothetical protein